MPKSSSLIQHCNLGVRQVPEDVAGVYALALKDRDNNFNDYAAQLEELAAEPRTPIG